MLLSHNKAPLVHKANSEERMMDLIELMPFEDRIHFSVWMDSLSTWVKVHLRVIVPQIEG